MMPNFSYVRAKSQQEAITASADGRTSIMAGSTDLLGCLRDRVFSVVGHLMAQAAGLVWCNPAQLSRFLAREAALDDPKNQRS